MGWLAGDLPAPAGVTIEQPFHVLCRYSRDEPDDPGADLPSEGGLGRSSALRVSGGSDASWYVLGIIAYWFIGFETKGRSDGYFEAKLERPVRRQVVAGPRNHL